MLDKLEELNSIKKFTEEVDPNPDSKMLREQKNKAIRQYLEDQKKRWAMAKNKKKEPRMPTRRNLPLEQEFE